MHKYVFSKMSHLQYLPGLCLIDLLSYYQVTQIKTRIYINCKMFCLPFERRINTGKKIDCLT